MPIYEYRCEKCGATAEFLIDGGQDEVIACHHCGGHELTRIMSAVSVLSHTVERAPGHTCCGKVERCETPPCSSDDRCRRG